MNNTYSIKDLLKKYKIEIPVIQRDYAQGRKGKEYVRKNFLEQIKSALKNKTETSLDFVYGNIENERFFPVDGQQRLTTLWLIYWYLSFKSGNLQNDYKTLENFSYETRETSRAFCKALCEKMKEVSADTLEIVEYIKQQTWFYESWLNDPTISAMLRTIGGDCDSKEDCIESVFKGVEYKEYYESLGCVKFELLVIGSEKLPVSDDLYIKMNARGKMLSDFDNLKADLISYVRSINPNNDKEKTLLEDLPKQIDATWTDVIWDYTSEYLKGSFNGKIDRAFFAFINRFVANEICLSDNFKVDDVENEYTKAFNKLYGAGLGSKSTANDTLVKYEGFENYKILTLDNLSKMNHLFNFLKANADIIKEIEEAFPKSDDDGEEVESSEYSFIPKYNKDKNLELIATTQKERIYFLAICLFIEKCKNFDKTEYEKWMRVVRNLTENAGIDSVSAMVSCMKLINELSTILDGDVYGGLAAINSNKQDTKLYQQLEEEIEKAKKITEDKLFEDKIKNAEQFAFFNGTIRFLFHNDKGNVDWVNFNTKFSNAQKLFNTGNNSVGYETIEKFLKLFNGWDDIEGKYLFTSIGYHPRKSCWKRNILCDESLKEKVHQFLMNGSTSANKDKTYQEFLDSGFIEKIVEKGENDKYRYTSTYINAIHKDYSSTECVYFYDGRKDKCKDIKNLVDNGTISIIDDRFNEFCKSYYWGMYVAFKYCNVEYRWYKQYGGDEDRIYKYVDDVQVGKPEVWSTETLLDVLAKFEFESSS